MLGVHEVITKALEDVYREETGEELSLPDHHRDVEKPRWEKEENLVQAPPSLPTRPAPSRWNPLRKKLVVDAQHSPKLVVDALHSPKLVFDSQHSPKLVVDAQHSPGQAENPLMDFVAPKVQHNGWKRESASQKGTFKAMKQKQQQEQKAVNMELGEKQAASNIQRIYRKKKLDEEATARMARDSKMPTDRVAFWRRLFNCHKCRMNDGTVGLKDVDKREGAVVGDSVSDEVQRTWAVPDMTIQRTFALEWSTFPPNPLPNPMATFICDPQEGSLIFSKKTLDILEKELDGDQHASSEEVETLTKEVSNNYDTKKTKKKDDGMADYDPSADSVFNKILQAIIKGEASSLRLEP